MPEVKSTISALIPLHQNAVGTETIQTVNARDLHAFLGVKDQFSQWMSRRISTYGFLQDIDYVVHIFGDGAIETKDFHITFDMAKELSMVEKTAKGPCSGTS